MHTFLYLMAGWFLFNLVFAVGMYFRPVRNRPPAPNDDGDQLSRDVAEASGISSVRLRQQSDAAHLFPEPGGAGKLLLFGFWLGNRLRPSETEEREPV